MTLVSDTAEWYSFSAANACGTDNRQAKGDISRGKNGRSFLLHLAGTIGETFDSLLGAAASNKQQPAVCKDQFRVGKGVLYGDISPQQAFLLKDVCLIGHAHADKRLRTTLRATSTDGKEKLNFNPADKPESWGDTRS